MAVGGLEGARVRRRRARRAQGAQRQAEAQTAGDQGPEFHADAINWVLGRVLGAFVHFGVERILDAFGADLVKV